MEHPKHQVVRIRYVFRCGYCGISETDAGGALTIDHFQPVSQGGDDSDDNLVYACFRCNLHKGAFVPSEAQRAQGLRLLHPLRDALHEHLRENGTTGRLEGSTPMGMFHIETLHLNRAELTAHRRRRWTDAALLAELDQSRAENVERREFIQHLRAQVRDLQERLRHTEERENSSE